MNNFLNFLFLSSPNFLQNCFISLFNVLSNQKKYGGKYQKYLKIYNENKKLSLVELKEIQRFKFSKLIKNAENNSFFYKQIYSNAKELFDIENIDNIKRLPIITKSILVKNKLIISTIKTKKGIKNKTGGTTGSSLEVVFTKDDWQDRFAFLDSFRNDFGYSLGKKTAWFSGKNIISENDIKKLIFWKSDYLYNVRYYSTFHINNQTLQIYIKNLLKFQPEFLSGFPSSINEIAKYGIYKGIDFPPNIIKAVFTTSETLTPEIRHNIELFFKTKIYDQYASAEGAPFIVECSYNKLHLELQTGVFEVLDENNNDSSIGRLIVTSFHSNGTPLIRYEIGDSIEMSKDKCVCGNNNPLVNNIFGRIDDFIYSSETGKIYLGNISNCTKNTKGILNFQIIQKKINSIEIRLEVDNEIFNKKNEIIFIKNLRDRVGYKMKININYVKNISKEKSGKFRLVKNYISKEIK